MVDRDNPYSDEVFQYQPSVPSISLQPQKYSPMPLDSKQISRIDCVPVYPQTTRLKFPRYCALCMSPEIHRFDEISDSYLKERRGPIEVHTIETVIGIPYCKSCWKKTHNHLLTVFELAMAILIGLYIAIVLLGAKNEVTIPVITTFFAAPFYVLFYVLAIYFLRNRKAVTINTTPDWLRFNFRNLIYAREFANLNSDLLELHPCHKCGKKMIKNCWKGTWYCLNCINAIDDKIIFYYG